MPWLVDLAIQSGPWTSWLLPSIALATGTALAWLAMRAWTARRSISPTHGALTALDEGRRVCLLGRLDRSPHETNHYVLRTATASVPVLGQLELAAPLDRDVLVEGFVGRLMRPALREQAGVLALRDQRDGRFFEPIRVRSPAPSRVELTLVGGTVLIVTFLLGTPLGWPTPRERLASAPFGIASLEDVASAVRLGSPTRRDALMDIAWGAPEQPLHRQVAARRELYPWYAAAAVEPLVSTAVRARRSLESGRQDSRLRVAEREREDRERRAFAALKSGATFPSECARWSHRPVREASDGPRERLCGLAIRARLPRCYEWSHEDRVLTPEYGGTTKHVPDADSTDGLR